MKVGTDGVLLGAWMSILPSDNLMLDIGSGTGLISIIVAQRSEENPLSKIIAVEIDSDSAEESEFNFKQSPWSEKLSIINSPIQKCKLATKFDLIFTNPPYFINSLKSPKDDRNTARHTDSLAHKDILSASQSLLNLYARLAIILPTHEAKSFIIEAEMFSPSENNTRLQLSRLCKVQTTQKKDPARYLMEFTLTDFKLPVSYTEESLIIHDGDKFSPEYISLTGEFYL